MALSKDGEDCDPSFHHAPSITITENAALVVGQSNGHHQKGIPIDSSLGRVVFLDICFPGESETFELSFVGGPTTSTTVDGDFSIELGVYVSTGQVVLSSGWDIVDGTRVQSGDITVIHLPDADRFRGTFQSLTADTRIAVLGGTALPEKRHMFWNFVSTSKDKVEQAANAWDRLDREIFPEVVNEDNKDSIPLPKHRK